MSFFSISPSLSKQFLLDLLCYYATLHSQLFIWCALCGLQLGNVALLHIYKFWFELTFPYEKKNCSEKQTNALLKNLDAYGETVYFLVDCTQTTRSYCSRSMKFAASFVLNAMLNQVKHLICPRSRVNREKKLVKHQKEMVILWLDDVISITLRSHSRLSMWNRISWLVPFVKYANFPLANIHCVVGYQTILYWCRVFSFL